MKIPRVIWLQTGAAAEAGEADGPVMTEDMTWCVDPINEHDTRYCRADLEPWSELTALRQLADDLIELASITNLGHVHFLAARAKELRND